MRGPIFLSTRISKFELDFLQLYRYFPKTSFENQIGATLYEGDFLIDFDHEQNFSRRCGWIHWWLPG